MNERGVASPPSEAEPLGLPPSAFRRISKLLAEELAARGLATARDLLLHRPSRYEDRRTLATVAGAQVGERTTLRAEVRSARPGRMRRGGGTLGCQLSDPSGQMSAIWFHARPWQMRELVPGSRFFFTGEVKVSKQGGRVLFNPEYEPIEAAAPGEAEGLEPFKDIETLHFGRWVPLYPGAAHPRALRTLIHAVLERILPALADPLPEALRTKLGLWPLARALRELHFPGPEAGADQLERADTEAHRRLAFDEFLWLSLGLARRRHGLRHAPCYTLQAGEAEVARVLGELPFPPTAAQRRATEEIARDLRSGQPMQRLLEGDVGSGKTAVAAAALRLTVESGFQGALMAPTELLAEQHHRSLSKLLGARVPIELVTSSTGGARSEVARALASGRPCLAIGTQALVQGGLVFGALALAVIDEQHRFGVEDRRRLSAKGRSPHILLMSATPIPRTLALTLHGDLDLSILDELPPGRAPIETRLLTGKLRAQALTRLRDEVAAGHQAYVVYPLIEKSEKVSLLAATEGAERLRKALPGARIGLVHGRLPQAEREATMAAFRDGALDVLVATTVVEVGVDVPNATLMIVSHAEGFGLSQLHQLRGRVGRGSLPSSCLLLTQGPISRLARSRLRALVELRDGFRLAEIDLELRGPGEVLGTRQSGLPELAFADPIRQPELLARAREWAFERIDRDPELALPESRELALGLGRLFGGARTSLGTVG